MARRLRDQGPMLALSAAGVWVMTYLGLYGFGWNDYATESLPAQDALTGGHLWRFLTLAPGYGGSLELRAPFALLASMLGGGEVAVYQAVSIPCLVAAALLGLWLAREMRASGDSLLARSTAVAVCVAGPVSLNALQFGHAEDILGGVLCVAAVLAAQRSRTTLAAVLLGLAIANKDWALLAAGPVLLATSPAGRRRLIVIAGAIVACFYVPLLLPTLVGHSASAGSGPAFIATGGTIVQPWQLWWFLGSHVTIAHLAFGVARMRVAPGWVQLLTHPLIVALGVPATLLASRRGSRDPMLLLALLFALRCAFDTWDTLYYPLPFILALLAWEVSRWRRAPVLSLSASVVVWLLFNEAPGHVSVDGLAALFALVAVTTIAALCAELYSPGALARRRSSGAATTPIPTV